MKVQSKKGQKKNLQEVRGGATIKESSLFLGSLVFGRMIGCSEKVKEDIADVKGIVPRQRIIPSYSVVRLLDQSSYHLFGWIGRLVCLKLSD